MTKPSDKSILSANSNKASMLVQLHVRMTLALAYAHARQSFKNHVEPKEHRIRVEVNEMKYLQISTAVGKRGDAEKIAETLVQKRLAGCVQIVGATSSIYWWKSKIEKTEEWLCLIKSQEALYHEVEEAIKKIHPYETPEIIAVPIVAGSKGYFRWLDQELREFNTRVRKRQEKAKRY